MKENKILKLKDLHTYYAAMYMFKVVKMSVPVFKVTLIFRSESTAIAQGEVVPFPRVECIKINYKYQFICTWNNLPEELKNTTTLSVFKKENYGISYCRLLSNSIIIEPFIVNKKNSFLNFIPWND